ncbi:hypothetical protein [Rufibacter psychrotolerans]|uniref:hypothetical protein n=1 Tax=Rufibacter psychrotolerans TaxID=2812556 RepID=UPI001967D636|nr:hypothetical protein [Rufibacter sp. SYSU D00308]
MKKLLYSLGIAFLLVSCKTTSVQETAQKAAPKMGTFTNHGVQLTSANLQASSFVQAPDGTEFAYSIVRGKPGHLTGYNMQTKQVVVDLEIKTAEGAIDMVPSTDNWLYIGASNGHLYRTRPGSQEMEDLGVALPGTAEVLNLTPGKDGEIFGGTYPTGKIFRYHPKDGFTDVAGQIVAGESYVRSMAYQHSTGKLYAGVGSHAHLIEVDPKAGTKKELLPEKYFGREFVYYLGIAEGVAGGDRMLGWVTDAKDRETLVYNLRTDKIEQVIPSLDANTLIKSNTTDDVYYTASNTLYRHNLTKVGEKPVAIAPCAEAKHMRWAKDGKLHVINRYGEIKKYDPRTGDITTEKIEVAPQPYGIQTLITGPDGRIWSSGFLLGGNAAFDPKTQKSTRYQGMGQAEGMLAFGNNIYFGIYPKARIYHYDAAKPWNASKDNPRLIGNVEEQDRPFAATGLADKNKLYFGTIPGYGKLGGALIEYDVATDKLQPFANVVPDQAVASLVYHNGLVWGGTTIFGGLGAKPTQKEGKVFAWDPVKKEKIAEFSPVPGTLAITCLVNGLDGKIWGFADGIIFAFDPKTQKVEKTKKLFQISENPTHIWRLGFLEFHPSGQVYGAANGEFFRLDPATMEITVLKKGVGLLAMDKNGVLYTRDSENLWSYRP